MVGAVVLGLLAAGCAGTAEGGSPPVAQAVDVARPTTAPAPTTAPRPTAPDATRTLPVPPVTTAPPATQLPTTAATTTVPVTVPISPLPPPPEPTDAAAVARPPVVPLAPGETGGTACKAVAHIGDSLTVGMTSPSYIGDPGLRLGAQYARVGVLLPLIDGSGGRSVVETLPDQQNGETVARAFRDAGFQGCWVIALGTNDTANVAVGSGVDRRTRIERILAVAAGEPVLWIDTRTLKESGAYAEANMVAWNEALAQAQVDHPNLVVYPWSGVVQDGEFQRDGIHLTPAGYAERARVIADALAQAFPG